MNRIVVADVREAKERHPEIRLIRGGFFCRSDGKICGACAAGLVAHDRGFSFDPDRPTHTGHQVCDFLGLKKSYLRGFVAGFDCSDGGPLPPQPSDYIQGVFDGRAVRSAFPTSEGDVF